MLHLDHLVIPSSSATAAGGSGALVTHIDETSLGHLTETTEDSQRVKGLTDFEVDSLIHNSLVGELFSLLQKRERPREEKEMDSCCKS
jgi:hypothetical protein